METIQNWIEGAAGALIISAAVRALPAPSETPAGFGQNFYAWFYRFTHGILANWDKLKKKQ